MTTKASKRFEQGPLFPPSRSRLPGWALLAMGLVGATLSVGCSNLLTGGSMINEHMHGHSDDPQVAPADGEYSLYSKFGDGTPLHTVPVRAGDPLGFRTGQTGQIDVIAGEDEWTMSDGDYIWKRN
jgi:hypothetical protein